MEELSKAMFGGKSLNGAFPHTQEQAVEKFERRPPWMKPEEDSEPEGDEKDPERQGEESDDEIEARVEGAAGKPEVDAPAVEAPGVDAPAVNAPKDADDGDDDPYGAMTLEQLLSGGSGEGEAKPPAVAGAPAPPAPPAADPASAAPSAGAPPSAMPAPAPAPPADGSEGAGSPGIDTSWADGGKPGAEAEGKPGVEDDGQQSFGELVDDMQGGQSSGSQPWDSSPRDSADGEEGAEGAPGAEAAVQAAAEPDLPEGPHPADPDLDPANGQVQDPAALGELPAPGMTTVGQFLSSQIHAGCTLAADRVFGAGYLTERERIALSGALARSLQVFGHTMSEEFPEIAARQMPSAVALQALKSRQGA